MIFDSLSHLTPDGKWFETTHNASLERLECHMSQFSVDKAVLSGGVKSGINDYVIKTAKKNQRYYPVPVVPKLKTNDLAKLFSCWKKHEVQAVKIHPRWTRTSLNEKWVQDVMMMCSNYRFKVFLCTVDFLADGSQVYSPPQVIANLCKNNQQTNIVLLHGGYVNILQTSEYVRPFENVLLDLSATLTRFYDSSVGRDISFLFRTFAKRICIGTDFPEFTYKEIKIALDYIGIDWHKSENLGVLGNNLKQFLDL